MLATYEDAYGFFKYPLSKVPSDEASGKEFLTAVRTLVGMLQFPSARYNAASVSVPVFAKPLGAGTPRDPRRRRVPVRRSAL